MFVKFTKKKSAEKILEQALCIIVEGYWQVELLKGNSLTRPSWELHCNSKLDRILANFSQKQ